MDSARCIAPPRAPVSPCADAAYGDGDRSPPGKPSLSRSSSRSPGPEPLRSSRSGEVVGAPPEGVNALFSAMATSAGGATPPPAANARAAAAASAPPSTRSEASTSKNAYVEAPARVKESSAAPFKPPCKPFPTFLVSVTRRTSSSSMSTSFASNLSRTRKSAPAVAGTEQRARAPTPFPATPEFEVSPAASAASRLLAFSTPCHLAHSPGSTTASLTARDNGVSAACSSFVPARPSTTQNLCTRRCPARFRSDRTIVSLCASTHAQRSQCSPGLCVYTTRTSVASGSSLFDTSTPRFRGCVCADAMATKASRALATASHASRSKSHRTL